MAFPNSKSNLVDGSSDILAAHINNLETKVGIDSSADSNSLDYRVTQLETNTPTDIAAAQAAAEAASIPITYLDTDAALTANSDVKVSSQKAIKAFVATMMASLYPVGTIYVNATNSANPATFLGFGTWVAFGAGKFIVGYNSGDTDFNASEKTGGAKTVDLSHTHTVANHQHTYSGTTAAQGATGGGGDGSSNTKAHAHTYSGTTDAGGAGSTGSAGSATQSILPPYITVYMWKRTA